VLHQQVNFDLPRQRFAIELYPDRLSTFFAFFQARSENVFLRVYRVYRVYRTPKPFAGERFLLNLLVHLVKNEGVPGVPGSFYFINFVCDGTPGTPAF
jgi:hypothetical protein